MNLLDKFHFKDKNGIQTTMEICDSFSRSKIAQILGIIPTKTSQLQNDSGFITSAAVPTKTSQLQNDSGFITSAAVPTKTSQLQNDSGFTTFSGNYNDLTNKPTIPTNTGALTTTTSNSGTWNRTNVGRGYGILTTTLASQSVSVNTAFGNLYYAEKSISIPSGIRLNTPIACNVTPIGDGGLFCQIRSFSNSAITMFVMGPAAGSYNIRFSVEMFGSL